MKDICENA